MPSHLPSLRNLRGTHAEAALCLIAARVVLIVPFRWLAAGLGTRAASSAGEADSLPPSERAGALVVRRSLAAAVRHLPWHSSCLVQAVAARLMLRRRGLPSDLHFGVRYDDGAKLAAHAWLRCRDVDIVGTEQEGEFQPIAVFVAR